MAKDVLSVFNLAASIAGSHDTMSSPDEISREAELCRLWYEPIRDFVLRAAPWASTKAFARLTALKARDTALDWAAGDPEPGFLYAYALPSNMIYPRYLANFGRFTMALYDQNRLAIMTNVESPVLCYSIQQNTPAMWDQHLYMAIAHALGAKITIPLNGKDQRARQAVEEANQLIMAARTSQANVDHNTYESLPEWITARGFGGGMESRFYYPFGPMLTLGDALDAG